MTQAIRQDITVQKDHRIYSPELKLGDRVEVILLFNQDENKKSNLRTLLGTGKGSFSSQEEADAFIRRERNTWE
ncbi:MAG TPA: hypothetical protein VHE99_09715 [Gammaproteobacteria bacterium]|nr:hypothetical protein [Gammaproteobacteria bacterium]